MEIASVILHESIHAEILGKILTEMPSPDPFNGVFNTPSDFKNEYNKIHEGDFEGINNHHDIIAKFYAENYAKAMHKLTGGQGKWEDYLFWAYHGLNVEQAIIAGSNLISQFDWNKYQADWNLVKNEINFNCE